MSNDNVQFLAKSSCYISDDSKIGDSCIIYPSVTIINSTIGDNVIIQTGAIIKDGSVIGNNCIIGPSALIRNNTKIGNNCVVGPGSELKNSTIGDNCNFAHKNFIGDATIENNVSFGFGACIANYDFSKINKTYIENNVRVGCNSVLVAPITIGKNSIITACCKVIKDIESNMFVKIKQELDIRVNKKTKGDNCE